MLQLCIAEAHRCGQMDLKSKPGALNQLSIQIKQAKPTEKT